DGHEVVLVSGYSGSGKSTLVRELKYMQSDAQVLFVEGKFDQVRQSSAPYSAWVQAFEELVEHIFMKDAADVESWKRKLAEQLGEDAALLTAILPSLELVLGAMPAMDLPPHEAHHRLFNGIKKFIGLFTEEGCTLVLFIDDLQWADPSSIRLF